MRRADLIPLIAGSGVGVTIGIAGAQTAPTGTPYKIGLTAPLTGPLSSIGASFVPALQLAVADVNRRGGVKGHPLEVVVEDTQGTPQGGVAALRKLADVDGVRACVTGFSNVIGAQIPLSNQLHIILLAPLESAGVMSAGQYSFSHAVTFPELAPYFRAYWQHVKAKRVFAFLANNAYGQSIAPFVADAAKAGGAAYDQAFVDLSATDVRGVVARAKEFNPDQVFVAIQGTLLEPAVIRALREVDVTAQIVVPGTWFQQRSWRAAAGPYAEGIVFGGLVVDPVKAHDFYHAYLDKTGNEPNYGDAELYDMGHMLAYAIRKGGYDGDGMRKALLTMRGVRSVFGGDVAMQEDHYSKFSSLGLWQVRVGKLVSVKT